MFECIACGHENPDTAIVCEKCGSDLEQQGHYWETSAPPGTEEGEADERLPSDPFTPLILSIIMTATCCLPMGIAGIIFSAFAMQAKFADNREMWRAMISYAEMCLVIGVVGAILAAVVAIPILM